MLFQHPAGRSPAEQNDQQRKALDQTQSVLLATRTKVEFSTIENCTKSVAKDTAKAARKN